MITFLRTPLQCLSSFRSRSIFAPFNPPVLKIKTAVEVLLSYFEPRYKGESKDSFARREKQTCWLPGKVKEASTDLTGELVLVELEAKVKFTSEAEHALVRVPRNKLRVTEAQAYVEENGF